MKKIIYSLLFVITAVCAACDEELPKASFDLYELKTLTATAGDMNVALSWEAYPDARPDEYLISWTSGSSGAEGGQMTVEAEASGATVSDPVSYTHLPIIGFLLVQVSTTGSVVAPAIGMLGFAIALALPFTLFALFPSWLKSMPKSGGWMNVIKVTLGFLELAFALKFLSVADLAYGWRLLDRETFLALWIVIFALLGFYLLGKIKFPHDDDAVSYTHLDVYKRQLL